RTAYIPAQNRACGGGSVESRCGAGAVGRACLFPPLSSGGASVVQPMAPFPHPAHSNRTCRFPASRPRTSRHAFAHGSLRPRVAGHDPAPSATARDKSKPGLAAPEADAVRFVIEMLRQRFGPPHQSCGQCGEYIGQAYETVMPVEVREWIR